MRKYDQITMAKLELEEKILALVNEFYKKYSTDKIHLDVALLRGRVILDITDDDPINVEVS